MNLSWTVTDASGEDVARCKYVQDAATLVALHGDYATISYGRMVVWVEGVDGAAEDDFKVVADTATRRVDQMITAFSPMAGSA